MQNRNYKLLICDEAHHSASKSYRKLIGHLGFMNGDNDKLLLGVTATPFRNDKLGLGDVFEKIVYEKNIAYMIENGYLCDVRGLRINTEINIKERAGDFDVNQLSKVINVTARNELIVDIYIDMGEKRSGVAFCANVSHALSLAEEFNRHGIKCKAVYGTMPSKEREKILNDYVNGELDILANVGVLTEGWDAPRTSIIMMARPSELPKPKGFGLLASLASSYTTYLAILAQRNKPPQDSSLSVPERRAYYYSALSSQS